jgi:hypothetical protein
LAEKASAISAPRAAKRPLGRIRFVVLLTIAILRGFKMSVHAGLMLVDRENRRGASHMFCEIEEDLRRVDDYMNAMTPVSGAGRRASVEMYEVVLDSDEL